MSLRLLVLALAMVSLQARAAEEPPGAPGALDVNGSAIKTPPAISRGEKAANFGMVLGAQIAFYVVSQNSIIRENGSVQNWLTHPWHPHFDYDNFDYNIVRHSLTGNYYYLFYRSRGYTERSAFFWTIGSSLLFEFGIETITEEPSFQDIYLTPVFGSILGIGMEKLSTYFHSIHTVPTTIIGYILNPMTLIPGQKCECHIAPSVGKNGEKGVVATLSF